MQLNWASSKSLHAISLPDEHSAGAKSPSKDLQGTVPRLLTSQWYFPNLPSDASTEPFATGKAKYATLKYKDADWTDSTGANKGIALAENSMTTVNSPAEDTYCVSIRHAEDLSIQYAVSTETPNRHHEVHCPNSHSQNNILVLQKAEVKFITICLYDNKSSVGKWRGAQFTFKVNLTDSFDAEEVSQNS